MSLNIVHLSSLATLLIPLCALLDRVRGGWSILPRWAHKAGGVVYGLTLGYLTGLPLYLVPAFAGLFWLGEKPGWGYPLGQAYLGIEQHKVDHPNAKPERWQVFGLKNHPWASVMIRGAIWVLPTLPLAYWHLNLLYILTVAPIAMAMGVVAEKRLTRGLRASGEAWRGGFMGLGCWVIGTL